MDRDPLAVIRDVRTSLAAWLESARKLPDPTAQPAGTVRTISTQIQAADCALRGVPRSVAAGDEWKQEVAAYADTLRELRALLNNFEITLRIRRDQMRNASAKIGIARSWSDLAKHIG